METRKTNEKQLVRTEYRQTKSVQKNPGFILAVVVFVLILVYIVFSAYSAETRESVPEVEIVYGQVDKPKTMKGIVIREEHAYKAAAAGYLSFQLHDKEKAIKNGEIARIEDREKTKNIENLISTVEENLLLEEMSQNTEHFFQKDIDKINKHMQDLSKEAASNLMQGDISSLYFFKENLKEQMDIRNKLYFSGATDAQTDMFTREKEKYTGALQAALDIIYATEGGIISYYVDGLEESLSVEDRLHISKEYIENFEEISPLPVNREVNIGDYIGKVVTSNRWYIAAYIPNELMRGWEVGQEKKIFLEKETGFQTEDLYIDTIILGENESYLLFRSDKYIHEYADKRLLQIRFSEELQEGLQIPVKSIVDKTMAKIPVDYLYREGGKPEVMKEIENEKTYIEVRVISEDDISAFIEVDYKTIKLDDVIYHPANKMPYVLSNIENIKGVYVTNTGVTTFQKISLEDSISTEASNYIILSPEKNKRLKVYDKIVADVDKVEERQTIY